MVLRFDRTFAQSYLLGISIDHTFSAIEYDRARRQINHTIHPPSTRAIGSLRNLPVSPNRRCLLSSHLRERIGLKPEP
ncbi:hypothetical protein QUB60_27115 [Microcoleus sp. A2-C5]|uniref:hypothetical protein n=1 Tax=Microcoleus sp. A2-C2 TaxID=2818530 RepID=UPI002FD4D24C